MGTALRATTAAAALAAALLTGCGSGTTPVAAPVGAAALSTPATVPAAPPSTPAPLATTPSAAPAVEAAAPKPVNHCAGNTARQLVLVSLAAQHMWLCEKGSTEYATAITSGMLGQDTATPTGRFHIEGRNRHSVLTLNTGATYDVQYWIPFDAPLFGFHDSSWQHFPYGSDRYKTDGSHGCIHMPLAAIAHLYRWVDIGADVTIA